MRFQISLSLPVLAMITACTDGEVRSDNLVAQLNCIDRYNKIVEETDDIADVNYQEARYKAFGPAKKTGSLFGSGPDSDDIQYQKEFIFLSLFMTRDYTDIFINKMGNFQYDGCSTNMRDIISMRLEVAKKMAEAARPSPGLTDEQIVERISAASDGQPPNHEVDTMIAEERDDILRRLGER